eukprot:TRINITY_DN1044_c0_g3_i1.p1 TRINITY_DN1044_c0_g3~~TRINITY_DN1044_c0_g3_i1.p1  ORF type:complete len:300 (+),score=36.03 TRINITY_DN1044_c0_g3_i1:90-902(+)
MSALLVHSDHRDVAYRSQWERRGRNHAERLQMDLAAGKHDRRPQQSPLLGGAERAQPAERPGNDLLGSPARLWHWQTAARTNVAPGSPEGAVGGSPAVALPAPAPKVWTFDIGSSAKNWRKIATHTGGIKCGAAQNRGSPVSPLPQHWDWGQQVAAGRLQHGDVLSDAEVEAYINCRPRTPDTRCAPAGSGVAYSFNGAARRRELRSPEPIVPADAPLPPTPIPQRHRAAMLLPQLRRVPCLPGTAAPQQGRRSPLRRPQRAMPGRQRLR